MDLFIEQVIDGKSVKFGKLTPRDRARILKSLRSRRREKLVENLKTAGINSEQTFAELEAFDDAAGYGESVFIEYINTPEGQDEVFTTSLQKYQSAEETTAILDKFVLTNDHSTPFMDATTLIASLCGYVMRTVPKPKDESKEAESSPTSGAPQPLQGYGAPEAA